MGAAAAKAAGAAAAAPPSPPFAPADISSLHDCPTSLVAGQPLDAEEGRHVEFKLCRNGNAKRIVADVERHACAFMNVEGGQLWFGVAERDAGGGALAVGMRNVHTPALRDGIKGKIMTRLLRMQPAANGAAPWRVSLDFVPVRGKMAGTGGDDGGEEGLRFALRVAVTPAGALGSRRRLQTTSKGAAFVRNCHGTVEMNAGMVLQWLETCGHYARADDAKRKGTSAPAFSARVAEREGGRAPRGDRRASRGLVAPSRSARLTPGGAPRALAAAAALFAALIAVSRRPVLQWPACAGMRAAGRSRAGRSLAGLRLASLGLAGLRQILAASIALLLLRSLPLLLSASGGAKQRLKQLPGRFPRGFDGTEAGGDTRSVEKG
jgi:hypothetical protein